jgi:hypothetical protein
MVLSRGELKRGLRGIYAVSGLGNSCRDARVLLLLSLPLAGLILAKMKQMKELSVGFIYAEIYATGVALLLWMASHL